LSNDARAQTPQSAPSKPAAAAGDVSEEVLGWNFARERASTLRRNGQPAAALPHAERAVATADRAFGASHENTSASLDLLAGILRDLGQYARAEPLYLRAIAIDEKVLGPAHSTAGARISNLGLLYWQTGHYAKAEALHLRAVAISEKAQGVDHPATGIRLNNLGLTYQAMGQYGKAEPVYLRALQIAEKALGANHLSTGIRLQNLAALYQLMGQYAKSEPLSQRALAIAEKGLGPNHPDVGINLNDLGLLYDAMGQYAQAEPLLLRALAISEKSLGVNHPETGTRYNNLAFVYQSTGQYAKALPLFQRALAIAEKSDGPEHVNMGNSLANLSTLHLAMNQHTEALPLARRSLAIIEKSAGSDHPSTGTALNNLAAVQQTAGRNAEALPLFQRALLIAVNSGAASLTWNVQDQLRGAYAREKQIEVAIYFGKQAVNTLQGMRARLSTLDTELQRSFLRDKTSVYRGLADLLIQQGRLAEAQHVLGMLKEEEFFDFVRRTEGDDPRQRKIAFQPHEQPWHTRLSELTARAGKAAAERADLERRAQLGLSDAEKSRLAQLNRDRQTLATELTRYYTDIAQAFSTAKGQNTNAAEAVAQLKAVQQSLLSLGAGSVLVQYVLSESRLNIIFTTATTQIARQIDIKSADLNQKIEFFRVALRNPAISALPMAQELHKLLIAPIEQELAAANARTVMFSLDGALRYIPMSALHDGKQYLIERFDLSLYTEVTKDNLTQRPGKDATIAGLGLTRQIEEFDALPAVKAELNSIVRNGNQGLIKGELHFDQQFNVTNIKQALQNKHPLIHLASHFVFRPGNESTSFLLLGDGDRLTLSRIRAEKLDFSHVDLVTLSACDTGVGGGRTAQGEEVEGLGALIQKQGAKGVIATLWPVADESTGLLMQNFYQLRETKKLSKADALRQAQLMLVKGQVTPGAGSAQRGLDVPAAARAKPAASYAHPYYWAPFILMGNWL
jgi:CHAT domain-containing protein/Tfp pilus assembly protein PilF